MGDQLVGIESSETEGGGKAPFCKIFWSCLPSYLAIGMTEDEYFRGDPALCKAYREAWKIKTKFERDTANWKAWLLGGYVYQTMGLMAGTYNSLKPQKPGDYLKKPFTFEDEKKKEDNPLFEYMMQFMKKHNERHS